MNLVLAPKVSLAYTLYVCFAQARFSTRSTLSLGDLTKICGTLTSIMVQLWKLFRIDYGTVASVRVNILSSEMHRTATAKHVGDL